MAQSQKEEVKNRYSRYVKGLVANASGYTIEIPRYHPTSERTISIRVFYSTNGARKGLADTACVLRTLDT